MTAIQCDATDLNGARCGLQAGHSGQHSMTAPRKASFGRILVTPVIVLIAALLIGSATGYTLPAVAIAAVLSIVYILIASRR